MVNDSIVEKFAGSAVAVAGVDVWNGADSVIGAFINQTGITFPIAKNGSSTAGTYGVVANSMVVIDQNGVVQYVKQLGTASTTWAIMTGMVSGAASEVRTLLANNAHTAMIVHRAVLRAGDGYQRYSLSGRAIGGNRIAANVIVAWPQKKARTECTLFK
jgi:hypothetical protein